MSRNHRQLHRARWQAVRLEVLDRDGWRCRTCGKAGRLEVDHVIPLEEHPGQDPYDPAGLQTLCRRCHADKSAAERGPPDPAREAWREFLASRLDSA